jgi:hypothetical protein
LKPSTATAKSVAAAVAAKDLVSPPPDNTKAKGLFSGVFDKSASLFRRGPAPQRPTDDDDDDEEDDEDDDDAPAAKPRRR